MLDGEVVQKTSAFIRKQARAKKPFYIYAALTQIHPPFLPHPDFEGKSRAGEYADIQMQVDHYVGEILDALDEADVADDTIVILTGDNAAGEHSINWGGEGRFKWALARWFKHRLRRRHTHAGHDSLARTNPCE